ncbi:MAG: hypothetical protein AB8H47_18455 [Bacteroidia bacterium]
MFHYSSILALLFICFFSNLQAQSVGVFNDPLEITAPGDVPGFTAPGDIAGITSLGDIPSILIIIPGASTFKSVSPTLVKTKRVPKYTKVSTRPITLKSGGKCYVFACADLKVCTLVWLDRNKDGKIQPRKELRCVDSRGNQCQMVIKQVKCK